MVGQPPLKGPDAEAELADDMRHLQRVPAEDLRGGVPDLRDQRNAFPEVAKLFIEV